MPPVNQAGVPEAGAIDADGADRRLDRTPAVPGRRPVGLELKPRSGHLPLRDRHDEPFRVGQECRNVPGGGRVRRIEFTGRIARVRIRRGRWRRRVAQRDPAANQRVIGIGDDHVNDVGTRRPLLILDVAGPASDDRQLRSVLARFAGRPGFPHAAVVRPGVELGAHTAAKQQTPRASPATHQRGDGDFPRCVRSPSHPRESSGDGSATQTEAGAW